MNEYQLNEQTNEQANKDKLIYQMNEQRIPQYVGSALFHRSRQTHNASKLYETDASNS